MKHAPSATTKQLVPTAREHRRVQREDVRELEGKPSSHWLWLACIKSRSGKFNQISRAHPAGATRRRSAPGPLPFSFSFRPPPRHTAASVVWIFLFLPRESNAKLSKKLRNRETTMKERRNTQPLVVRCKLVLVGDVQCGKTAMLQVLAKDCYPEVRRSITLHNSNTKWNAADELESLLYMLSPVRVCVCVREEEVGAHVAERCHAHFPQNCVC